MTDEAVQEQDDMIQGQIEAVLGCADALEAMVPTAPEELKAGINFSVLVMRLTARSFDQHL